MSALQLSSLCQICGARKDCIYQAVGTCRACKEFFQRSGSETDLKCVQGTGSCEISPEPRRRCRKCRLEKCLEVGWRNNWSAPHQPIHSLSDSQNPQPVTSPQRVNGNAPSNSPTASKTPSTSPQATPTFSPSTIAQVIDSLPNVVFFPSQGYKLMQNCTDPIPKLIENFALANFKDFLEVRSKANPWIREASRQEMKHLLSSSWEALHLLDVAYATANFHLLPNHALGNGRCVSAATLGLLGFQDRSEKWEEIVKKLANGSRENYALIHLMLLFWDDAEKRQQLVNYVGNQKLFEIVGMIRSLAADVKEFLAAEKANRGS